MKGIRKNQVIFDFFLWKKYITFEARSIKN